MSEKKFHTKYPAFTLGIDSRAVVEMGMKTNCLENKPWWWFEDNGAALGLSDETPNSKLVNSRLVIRQRNRLETDESVLQILPYTIVGWKAANPLDQKVSTYYRVPGAGEKRLDGKTSIGYGGHPEYTDFMWSDNGDLDLKETLIAGILRELAEELRFIDSRTGEEVDIHLLVTPGESLQFRGFIYDTSNPVGRVHLAVVHYLELPDYITVEKRKSEASHLHGPELSLQELNERQEQFEPWSRIIINDHFEREAAVNENLNAHEEQYRDAQYHRLAAEAGQADSVETPATILHETVLSETLKADAS
jgi:predicted NUDIX family phosphoesterase